MNTRARTRLTIFGGFLPSSFSGSERANGRFRLPCNSWLVRTRKRCFRNWGAHVGRQNLGERRIRSSVFGSIGKGDDQMPRGRNAIRATSGYRLKQKGRKGVALMRGQNTSATFNCECSTSGGCKVTISGQSAECEESGCTGACSWVVRVAGLAGIWAARKA